MQISFFTLRGECRRLAIIITDNPNLDLAHSSLALADLPKLSDKRPRIVIVLPNAPFPTYPMPNRGEMVVAPEDMLKEKYNKEGMQMFNRYAEYDLPVHDDDQQLRNPHPHLTAGSQPSSNTTIISNDSLEFRRAVEAVLDGLNNESRVPQVHSIGEKLEDSTRSTSLDRKHGKNDRRRFLATGQDDFLKRKGLFDTEDNSLSHSISHGTHEDANVLVTCLGENLFVPLCWPDLTLF